MTSPVNDSTNARPDREADDAAARKFKERVLVFIVVFLGLLIVGGLVAVVGRIIYLSSAPSAQRALPEPSAKAAVANRLDLPAGAVVKSVAVDGDRLAVHYEAPSGAGIAVLDLATGVVLRRVEVVPGGMAP